MLISEIQIFFVAVFCLFVFQVSTPKMLEIISKLSTNKTGAQGLTHCPVAAQ